ncbi:MAG: 1-acyl-sn-glycerol-3-phosphate acyltransferase, partial [Candidatus Eremiobacteraeota bacterium]|nr:1-acyl-sn-glycerol-3-phosphate acyltransferase [Candidatus Eremiobacteraeota bacterium]
ANHNSHLDTVVLMMACPKKAFPKLRPVAAADYFLKNKLVSWFSLNIIRIIPIHRKKEERTGDPLAPISDALRAGEIVIFFPEGSRGEPEQMTRFKSGIARLAERHPQVPVVPVFMRGLGRALPRGEGLLVPFFLDLYVGQPRCWHAHFMEQLQTTMDELSRQGHVPRWD